MTKCFELMHDILTVLNNTLSPLFFPPLLFSIYIQIILYITKLYWVLGFWGEKVFLRLRPQEPKLPSSVEHWRVALFKRYPGVCRVYAIIVLVFEQIPEYCGHLGPF